MKILVFGAGVVGGIYAAKLFQAGNEITLLARGNNFKLLKEKGLILADAQTGKKLHFQVPVIEDVKEAPASGFDLIIVTVRLQQLKDSLDAIKAIDSCNNILFMLNNPEELRKIDHYFPDKNIYLGFSGAGGTKKDNLINFVQIKQQKTTIGRTEKSNPQFLVAIKNTFESAGFSTQIEPKIKDWLIVHSVFISCVTASIIKEKSSSEQLGSNRESVKEMVQSIKEGFKACKQQNIDIVPKNIQLIFLTMPEWFCVFYWQRALKVTTGKLGIEPHAKAATDEMRELAKQVLKIVNRSTTPRQKINNLLNDFI